MILAAMVLTQTLAAQTPISPQAAAIDQLLVDAEAARMKADFATMQTLTTDAVSQSRTVNDPLRLSKSLNARAQASYYLSQSADCVTFAREAAAVVAPLSAPTTEIVILSTLANCLRGVGDFEEAIDLYRRVVGLSQATHNLARESNVLANIAMVYSRLGEFDMAQASAERAVERARESQDVQREAFALQVLANALGQGGQAGAAVAMHRRSLSRTLDLPPSGFATLAQLEERVNIGVFEFVAGRFDSAFADLTEVATLSTSSAPYPLAAATSQTYLGWTAYRLGQLSDAERWFLLARQSWRTINDANMVNEVLLTEIGYALVLRSKGNTAGALAVDQATLATLDRLRSGRRVTDTSAATSLLPATRVYADTIDLLLLQGRAAEAFDVSEHYRARLFLDTLDEHHSGIGKSMTVAQRAREATLTDDGTKLQLRIWDAKASDTERASLKAQLAVVDQDLDALRREVRRQDSRYGAVRFPLLLTSADVTRTLDATTAVVSYVLGEERSFVFVLTSAGVTSATLPGDKTLGAAITPFRELLSTRPAPGSNRLAGLRAQASALSTTLLAPVAERLSGKQHVILLTDGALNELPFEALGAIRAPGAGAPGGRWLTEQFALSYAPSASALRAIGDATRVDARPMLLAVGDPDLSGSTDANRYATIPFTALPFTRVEVERISQLLGSSSRALLGVAASPEALSRESIGRYRYIHFAAHAFVNATRPGRSGIVLSPNATQKSTGILQADDVMKLQLNADLVTLSACSTGLGKTIAGEGVMGLARSFLIAGSRSVAASLWNINDEATAAMMVTFYTGLKAGLPRDEALSAARRSLIHGTNERLKDPYYWAPFILIGVVK